MALLARQLCLQLGGVTGELQLLLRPLPLQTAQFITLQGTRTVLVMHTQTYTHTYTQVRMHTSTHTPLQLKSSICSYCLTTYVHSVFTSPSTHTASLRTLCVHFTFSSCCLTTYTLCSLHLLLMLPHYVQSVFTSPSAHTASLRTLCVHFTFCSCCLTTYTLCSLHLLLELCSELCDLSRGLLPETAQLVLQPLLPLHCSGLGLHQGWGAGKKWEVWQGVRVGEKPFCKH